MPTIASQMTLRQNLARILTEGECDNNLILLAQTLDAMLAGTAGYEAGNALKLAGVVASSFWNNANCTKLFNTGGIWQKLASGLIIQGGQISLAGAGASSTTVTFNIANPVNTSMVLSCGLNQGLANVYGTGSYTLSNFVINHAPGTAYAGWVALGY